MKQLKRSKKNRIIAGVCGGIAEYFGIDPTLVRLIWVLITLAWGAGLLLYIVAWLIMPEEGEEREEESKQFQNTEGLKILLGGLLIFLGIVLLVSAFLPFLFNVSWKVVLAVLLVIFGVLLLLRRNEK
ncbi:PspC domain-containing protein [Thermotoga sp.]|uniref:PspC domain-containing protein n=1 Tax=Thermotoga sp. TaxID=28240 RepID=UPI0025D942D1|nr:PspC domain-containing protein [Thermotoga sp.]MCD6551287.1 PspC domain-containing protein [Thermotoga sp.]